MNITKTFLNLTSKTYPHGTEHLLEEYLPDDIQKDKFGNYFYVVGDGSSRVIFASHLDTVSWSYEDVTHTFSDDDKIVGTDGTTTLGADDKAGVTIMLYMIEKKVPGLYYFFIGEEVGCIGSGKVSTETHIFNQKNYDKIISFDRRGNTSVITHQSSVRCCSDIFANDLCDQLNNHGLGMEIDSTGVCTDSLEFVELIPECTNLSVGYLDEHTPDETQDLEFLEKMCKACSKVDWESLPTRRNPKVTEYKTYKRNNKRGSRGGSNYNSNLNPNNGGLLHRNFNFPRQNDLSLAYGYIDSDDDGDDGLDYPRAYNQPRNPFDMDGSFGTSMNEYGEYDEEEDDNDNYYTDDYKSDLFQFRDIRFDIDSDKGRENFFESVKDKYMDDGITDSEILIIKEQMLDLDDPIDSAFADDIDEIMMIKNSGI